MLLGNLPLAMLSPVILLPALYDGVKLKNLQGINGVFVVVELTKSVWNIAAYLKSLAFQ